MKMERKVMKRKRTALIISLALIVALCILVGCTSSTTPSPSAPTSATTTVPQATSTPRPTPTPTPTPTTIITHEPFSRPLFSTAQAREVWERASKVEADTPVELLGEIIFIIAIAQGMDITRATVLSLDAEDTFRHGNQTILEAIFEWPDMEQAEWLYTGIYDLNIRYSDELMLLP